MRLFQRAAAVCAVALAAGCSGDTTAREVAKLNTANAQRLANLYAAHQNYKAGAGPATEAEFRQFVGTYAPDKLALMGVKPTDLDALFKSERDGQPLKVRYKVGGGRGSVDAVVFEAVGKDGKRQVGFTGGKLEEVGDADYQAYLSGKVGHVAATKSGVAPKDARNQAPPPS